MFGDLSQCVSCKYLRSWYMGGTDTATCAAYPAGIPDELWLNAVDHRGPAAGDNGILWESNGEPFPEWALAEDVTPVPASERGWTRIAGHDTHPGGEQLKHYWTEDPEGLAKWVDHPHPWTALYHHLLKHMDGNEALAKATASAWYHKVKGIWVGETKGKNPYGPG